MIIVILHMPLLEKRVSYNKNDVFLQLDILVWKDMQHDWWTLRVSAVAHLVSKDFPDNFDLHNAHICLLLWSWIAVTLVKRWIHSEIHVDWKGLILLQKGSDLAENTSDYNPTENLVVFIKDYAAENVLLKFPKGQQYFQQNLLWMIWRIKKQTNVQKPHLDFMKTFCGKSVNLVLILILASFTEFMKLIPFNLPERMTRQI